MSITVKGLSYTYSRKTPYEKKALDNVDLEIKEGEFVGIIGHTGSGKSTFIQHINGLIRVQEGEMKVFDIDLAAKKPDLKRLRREVGMVFQYPEYQLFDETVAKDVAFGAKNLGVPKEEIEGRVREAMDMVGLDYETFKDRSPFDLSGGQKRRAAIAGVIVMRPKVLILDEPTAGLDPLGKEQILSLILKLKSVCSPTVIVVSHDIDEITRYCTRLIAFNEAKVAFDVPMEELFEHKDELLAMGLDIPEAVKIRNLLRERGIDLGDGIFDPDSLLRAIGNYYNGKHADKLDMSVLAGAEKIAPESGDGLFGEGI